MPHIYILYFPKRYFIIAYDFLNGWCIDFINFFGKYSFSTKFRTIKVAGDPRTQSRNQRVKKRWETRVIYPCFYLLYKLFDSIILQTFLPFSWLRMHGKYIPNQKFHSIRILVVCNTTKISKNQPN